MPRRSTIGKNPLEDLNEAAAKKPSAPAEGDGITADAKEKPVRPSPDRSRGTFERLKGAAGRASRILDKDALAGETPRANGGRLELLGGSFGSGFASISKHGADRQLGFVAPQGERIDLEAAIDAVELASDRQEHRLLSAAGWAFAAGTFFGPVGLALGGGLRLLHPRKMVINVRLRDGRTIVARTDSITAAALQELAAENKQSDRSELAPA